MAVSRLTCVVQTMAPAQIIARTTQIAAVIRTQIFKSAMRGIQTPPPHCCLNVSGSQIDLLNCASRAVFLQKYSGIANLAKCLIRAIREVEGGGHAAQGNGTDIRCRQRVQLIRTLRIASPDFQLAVGGVIFIDPAVTAVIQRGQFLESIIAAWAEQFLAIIDLAVAVTIKNQEPAARGNKADLFRLAITVQVEGKALVGQLRGVSGKVEDQRIGLAGRIAQPQAGARFHVIAARHRQVDAEGNLPAICCRYLAAGGKLGLLGFTEGLLTVVSQY